MFCKNCGSQLEEGWKACPNCGETLGKIESSVSADTNLSVKSRQELKNELSGAALRTAGGVVSWYGSNRISKDLIKVLQPGEEIIKLFHAYRNSLAGQLKNERMFRKYMVCTNKRLIYIESGCKVLALIPFFWKVVSYPYHEIISAEPGKRVGIYSGKIIINSQKGQVNFAMMDNKDAVELSNYLMEKRG